MTKARVDIEISDHEGLLIPLDTAVCSIQQDGQKTVLHVPWDHAEILYRSLHAVFLESPSAKAVA